MSLDPAVLQKLLAEVPEMHIFRTFLAEEALKLNTLEGLSGLSPEKLAIEVVARERARDVLQKMLGPLINPQEAMAVPNPKDYTVDPDDLP